MLSSLKKVAYKVIFLILIFYNYLKVMHSHDYRANSEFRGKRVAVLGAAASGQDIGLEIAQAAAKVRF